MRIDQDSFGFEILHPGNSHFLVLSGLMLQWYPRGRVVVLAGMFEHMVGNVTRAILLPLHVEKEPSPRACAILFTISVSTLAPLTLRN